MLTTAVVAGGVVAATEESYSSAACCENVRVGSLIGSRCFKGACSELCPWLPPPCARQKRRVEMSATR